MPDNGTLGAMGGGAAAPDAHAGAAPGGQSPIDVQQLAEKVYALLVAEARVGHARTESATAAKRSVED
jgi:hypothetical protein